LNLRRFTKEEGFLAPLKHTTMLTVKKSGKDSAEVKVDDSELEV
jgi:hypothetical protein